MNGQLNSAAFHLKFLALASDTIKWERAKKSKLTLVHKRMFYIRMNLRMLEHSNVDCNIRMLILCNKMMYFVILWSLLFTLAVDLYLSPNKHECLMVFT